jgi:single-strand DNA-binding protein
MLNRVIMIGRLTKDPELRTTNTGKSVASFRIAVDRFGGGEDKQTDFFNVSCWERQAEYVSNYLQKGRLVAVDGRIQNRQYTAQDGTEKYFTEIVAQSVHGLDRPKDPDAQPTGPADAAEYGDYSDDDPFAAE